LHGAAVNKILSLETHPLKSLKPTNTSSFKTVNGKGWVDYRHDCSMTKILTIL